MKKALMLLAAMVLVFSISGQAMAYFTAGDLIQVVYKTGGTGNEVLTDLGSITNWTTPGSVITSTYGSNPVSLGQFTGSAWSDLNVAYFTESSTGSFWISGPQGGQTNNGGQKNNLRAAINSALTQAAANANGTAQAVQASNAYLNSYWNLLDKNMIGAAGTWGGYSKNNDGEANLASLATGGSVDLQLYYYPAATSNLAGSGVNTAKMTIFSNGTAKATPVASPIPAPIVLLGSGLLGLIGIGRKKTA